MIDGECVPMPSAITLPAIRNKPPPAFAFLWTAPKPVEASLQFKSVSFFSPVGPIKRGSAQSAQSQLMPSPASVTTSQSCLIPVMSISTVTA